MNFQDIKRFVENRKKEMVEKVTNTKRKLANKPSTKYVGKKLAGIALVTLIALGGLTGCATANKENKQSEITPTGVTDIQKEDKYSNLNSPKAVLEDFKVRYVEKYNKKNGTSYLPKDINLMSTHQTHLYLTKDGQYVTHGGQSQETINTLKELYGEGGFVSVYQKYTDLELHQILLGDTETPIEAYTKFIDNNGKKVETPVISGTLKEEDLKRALARGEGKGTNGLGTMYDLAEHATSANDQSIANSDAHVIKYKNVAKVFDEKERVTAQNGNEQTR